jgi:drug/metabolite transporter (DMT)-like permease
LLAVGSVALAVFLLVVRTDRETKAARRELGLGIAAGLLFGLGDVLMKIGTEIARDTDGRFDLASSQGFGSLFGTVEFHLSIGVTACAFLLQQAAFSRGRVSLIAPLIGASGTIVVLLLGSSLLREAFGPTRLLAVAVMVFGTLLLALPPGISSRRPPPGTRETSHAQGGP